MNKISVFIVDDHGMIREGIKACLSPEEDIQVIGEAGSGEEALEVICEPLPDVIIMDINMEGMNGIATTVKLLEKYPDLKIMGLTMYEDLEHITNLLQSGAMGYILKGTESNDIVKGVRAVYENQKFFSSEVSEKLMNQAINPGSEENEAGKVKLTRREEEILILIAEEYTNHEIAEKLFISQRTVDTHRRNLIQKLNARNTAGLVRYAIKHKLIEL